MRLNLNRCVRAGVRPCVRVRTEGDERGLNVLRTADASRKVEVISCLTRGLILRKTPWHRKTGEEDVILWEAHSDTL